jgi:hypothetical protein
VRAWLETAAAYGELAMRRIEPRKHGERARAALETAVRLAPESLEVALASGRAVLATRQALSQLWVPLSIVRLFIDIDAEGARALGIVRAHPESAVAQLVQQRLAHELGSDPLEAEATGRLAELQRSHAGAMEVAEAMKQLASDQARVNRAFSR